MGPFGEDCNLRRYGGKIVVKGVYNNVGVMEVRRLWLQP
jgi:hypothetical protein